MISENDFEIRLEVALEAYEDTCAPSRRRLADHRRAMRAALMAVTGPVLAHEPTGPSR